MIESYDKNGYENYIEEYFEDDIEFYKGIKNINEIRDIEGKCSIGGLYNKNSIKDGKSTRILRSIECNLLKINKFSDEDCIRKETSLADYLNKIVYNLAIKMNDKLPQKIKDKGYKFIIHIENMQDFTRNYNFTLSLKMYNDIV